MTTTSTYSVRGLTCGFCVAEVLEGVRELTGVTAVAVDLFNVESSRLLVTSTQQPDDGQVRTAVEHAGFVLTPPAPHADRLRSTTSATREK